MSKPFSLGDELYDQTDYFGRLRKFIKIIDPRNLSYSDGEIREFQNLLVSLHELHFKGSCRGWGTPTEKIFVETEREKFFPFQTRRSETSVSYQWADKFSEPGDVPVSRNPRFKIQFLSATATTLNSIISTIAFFTLPSVIVARIIFGCWYWFIFGAETFFTFWTWTTSLSGHLSEITDSPNSRKSESNAKRFKS